MEIPFLVHDVKAASESFMTDHWSFTPALKSKLGDEVRKWAEEGTGDPEVLQELYGLTVEGRNGFYYGIKLAQMETELPRLGKQTLSLSVIPVVGGNPTLFKVLHDKFGKRFCIKATFQRLVYAFRSDREILYWYTTTDSGVAANEQGEVHAKLTFKECTPCSDPTAYTYRAAWGLQGLSGRLHLYLCFRATTGTSKRKLSDQCAIFNNKMLKMEVATDVVIVSGDEKEFKCHKSFLFMHSPVLQAMLMSGMEETRTSRIVVPDMSGEVVEAFLQYLYAKDISEVAGSCELSFGLLYAAHKYQVKCLEAHAIGLLQNLNNEHFPVEIALKLFLLLGNVPSSEELKKKAAAVMSEKFDALAALPEYDELDVKVVKELNKYFAMMAKINRG